jgi:hypothetical protein
MTVGIWHGCRQRRHCRLLTIADRLRVGVSEDGSVEFCFELWWLFHQSISWMINKPLEIIWLMTEKNRLANDDDWIIGDGSLA